MLMQRKITTTKGVEDIMEITNANFEQEVIEAKQPVIVDFWASWCPDCRKENPNIVAAWNKYKDKNFTILGVSLDRKKEPWLAAIEKDQLAWTHVSDLKDWKSDAAVQYAIRWIPMNFLLDPNGVILAVGLEGEALQQKLDEVLK